MGRQQLVEVDGELAGCVVVPHDDEEPDTVEPVAHPGDPVAERRVEDEGLAVAVVDQVDKLFVEVPVVDVDRPAPVLERGLVGEEVFGTVVEVQRHLAAPGHPGRLEGRGDAGAVLVEAAVGPAPVALDEGIGVGHGVGHPLVRGREWKSMSSPRDLSAGSVVRRSATSVTRRGSR